MPKSRGNNTSTRRKQRNDSGHRTVTGPAKHDPKRRQRIVIALVGFVLLASMFAGFAGSTTRSGSASSSTSTSSSTTVPEPGVELPTVAPGAAMSSTTSCPAEDGSSPRTTTFAGPPPMCIDPTIFYKATIKTSVGNLVVNVNPHQAPRAANNFIVLSRYHYYDGQPITGIMPRMAFVVGADIDNPDGVESPGYTVGAEIPENGQVFVFGSIAMVPTSESSDDFSAAFVIATYENATSLPQNLTQFGFVMEGDDTVKAIDSAGNSLGQPTQVITVDSITITPGEKINITPPTPDIQPG